MATRDVDDWDGDNRPARLSIRITQEQKDLFKRAAEAEGRTLKDFVITHLERISADVIREGRRIELSSRNSELFVRMLLDPPELNENLRRGWAEYQRSLGTQQASKVETDTE